MALPKILVNSATGSDSAASGAGPATALTGSAASFSGAVITLDGSPDLSGVDTTGLHVIYLVTSTGVRFFKITAKDNTAKTVTVTPNPAGTSTGRTWAIGGKRASVASSTSRLLFDNGGSDGDAKGGWTIELESGHAESHAGPLDLRSPFDTSNGPVYLQGTFGAATMPVLTNTGDSNGLVARGNNIIQDLEFRNSNGSKTASTALSCGSSGLAMVRRCRVNHQTNYHWKGFVNGGAGSMSVECSEVAYCASHGMQDFGYGTRYFGNWVHHNGGDGFQFTSDRQRPAVMDSIFNNNGGDGLSFFDSTALEFEYGGVTVVRCTFYGNTGDGLSFDNDNSRTVGGSLIHSNIFVSNGGYAINAAGGATKGKLDHDWFRVYTNAFYSNTSGKYNPSDMTSLFEVVLSGDPFTNASGGDFTLNTTSGAGAACRDGGFPAYIGSP